MSKLMTLSAELADLLDLPLNTKMRGASIYKCIQKYIIDNRLNSSRNGFIFITPDEKLAKISNLQPGVSIKEYDFTIGVMRYLIETSEKLNRDQQNKISQQFQSTPFISEQLNPLEQTMSMSNSTSAFQNYASAFQELQNEEVKMHNKQVSVKSGTSVAYMAGMTGKKTPKSYTKDTCPTTNATKLQKIVEKSPEDEVIVVDNILPVDNINLCFVGGVSTGKSTILNAIFCEELTQCKIKRTTMVPTVYIENENDAPNLDAPAHIFDQISQKNKEIIEKTESGAKVKDSEYAELRFNVGKLDINILPDSYVNVYDIPGLNDARTKSVYYKYLQRNFYRFNLVVFIVDIHSGLNTSDEADILNFIADHTRRQFDTNQKKIYTLVVVNKADDMQLVPESDNDELEITGELGEMFAQVENTVTEAFRRRDIAEHLVGIIPLCAIDSYLYRMTQKHGDRFKLTPEQILKIGINENGKKFSILKPKTQEERVRKILDDKEFVNTMIKLSGFGHFEKLLHTFLSQNNTGKSIRIENLLFELKKLPSIGAVIDANPENVGNIVIVCRDMFRIFNAILKIDKEQGDALVDSALAEIIESLKKYLAPLVNKSSITELSSILDYYNQFKYSIFLQYFDNDTTGKKEKTPSESRWSGYPGFVQNIVFERVNQILNTSFLKPDLLMVGVELCKTVGVICKANFEALINNILKNVNKYSTFINGEVDVDNANIIAFSVSGVGMGLDMTTFLRFVLLNRITDNRKTSDRVLFQKQMIYLKYGEVPIYSYLQHVNHGKRVLPEWVVNGLNAEIMDDPAHQLDLYYLNYISQSKP